MKREIKEVIEKFCVEEVEKSLKEIKYFSYIEKGFARLKKDLSLNDDTALNLLQEYIDSKKETDIFSKLNITNPELIKFIQENMLNLKQVSLKDFPNYIMYYNDKNEKIFQQNLKTS